MRTPIRYQLMAPLLLVAATGLVAVAVVSARLATSRTTERIERQLRGVVQVLAESTYPLTDSVLRQMAGLANAEFLLTDAEGRRLASSSGAGFAPETPRGDTAESIHDVRLGPRVLVDSVPMRRSAVWLRRRSEPGRPRVLHVLFAESQYDAAWQAAFLPPLVVGAAMIAAVAVVTHLAAARISRTLGRLGGEVRRLAEGDFSPVAIPSWDDETRDLVESVNQTARRLAEYESRLRRGERLRTVSMLGAGLAHELRNAATGCRLALDLHAEGGCGDRDDEGLAVARRQLTAMENRLRQLLRLGREDGAARDTTLDFGEVVTESLDLLEPAAAHAGVRLEWSRPSGPTPVRGDGETLRLAVTNILANALDAAAKAQASAAEPGVVGVALHPNGEAVRLVVTDTGDGPDAAVAENVFEPFSTTKPEGVGVGLAVTRQVVESLGGRIGWTRRDDRTEFSIDLPLQREEAPRG